MQFAWGYAPMLIISAALRHGLFDRLERGSRSLEELAQESGASARGLRALLNALVGLQLLDRDGDRYRLSPESAAFLVSSGPEYRGRFFEHHLHQLLPQWLRLAEVVRTGRPVTRTNREPAGGDYFAAFVESLFPVNRRAAEALARELGLERARPPVSVLDLGAGSGVWGITLAEAAPGIRVHAVDWPGVLEVTRKVAARQGVADRLNLIAGDFLEADLGSGHAVATLGHILHSEGPDRIRSLLRRTWNALAPGGVIAIQEFLPDDDRRGPAHPLLFAVNMLVNTEAGDTYTFAEIRAWLEEAGFVQVRPLVVPSVSPLVLATKPDDSDGSGGCQ